MLLPFALVRTCDFSVIFFAGMIAFVVLGIEEVGVMIEEPFTILPLEMLCTEIEKSTNDIEAVGGHVNANINPAMLGKGVPTSSFA